MPAPRERQDTPADSTPTDHWPAHARQWSKVDRPLRPGPEDVAVGEAEAARWQRERPGARLRALLLGVTPELATLGWPEGTALTAVDRSAEMIGYVWPAARVPAGARALRGNWLRLPVEAGSADLCVGDGCFSALPRPDEYRTVAREIRRAIGAEGTCVMRVFAAPERRERISDVARDLFAGRIGSFHCFKWRLAMSLPAGEGGAVRLADIWDAWRAM